jgi:hypothetical protein
LKNIA